VLAILSELPIASKVRITDGVISEEEARAKILESVRPLPARKLPILEALNHFAAEDYFAGFPLPNFDNSSMDGYAVIAREAKSGKRLRVTGEQPAGKDQRLRILPGETIRIFTGAPMPAGADAVVMQEDVTRTGDEIILNSDVDPSEFVRLRGGDLSEGQKILSAGDRIRAATIALLASQGFAEIAVGGEPRVGIVSTGDELAMPGEELQPGEIYDSNLIFLQTLVQNCKAMVTTAEHCGDDPEKLLGAFKNASKGHLLVVTGGVSVGEHDLVQSTLCSLGAKIEIWRVAIKPGKPFFFGRLDDCLVFGLPGNPVSAFVTFLQFVRPAILRLMGAGNLDLPRFPATLGVDLTNDGDRAHYFRGKLQAGKFSPTGRQESHAIFGLSQSNALLRLASGESRRAGESVEVQVWD